MGREDKKFLHLIGSVVCIEFLDHFITSRGAEKAIIEAFGLLEDEDNEYLHLTLSRFHLSDVPDYVRGETFKILKTGIKHITEFDIKKEIDISAIEK